MKLSLKQDKLIKMREKLVTSAGSVPGVEHALLDRQLSTDSTMFENPFRAGGELSKDAANILDALKTGKLDDVNGEPEVTGKQHPTVDTDAKLDAGNQKNDVKEQSEKRSDDSPEVKSKEVQVERVLVINPKHANVEHVVIPEEKKKSCFCCVLQ